MQREKGEKNGLAVLGFEAGEMGPWAEEWKQPLEMERHRTHIFPRASRKRSAAWPTFKSVRHELDLRPQKGVY